MAQRFTQTISDTSPAAPGTAAGDSFGIGDADTLTITATLQGATGGPLDVYLQSSWDGGTTWEDFAHFPQLAAAAAVTTKVWHVHRDTAVGTLTAIGTGTSPALAADTILGGAFGPTIRALYVAGALTTLGAAQTIVLRSWRK